MGEADRREAAHTLVPEIVHEEVDLVAQRFHVRLVLLPELDVGGLALLGAAPLAAVVGRGVAECPAAGAAVQLREISLFARST